MADFAGLGILMGCKCLVENCARIIYLGLKVVKASTFRRLCAVSHRGLDIAMICLRALILKYCCLYDLRGLRDRCGRRLMNL
jgi:hypothetical protein